jgi:hypothetical protein
MGCEFLYLYCASGRVLQFNAVELDGTPFDAYSLAITEMGRNEVANVVAGIDVTLIQLQGDHRLDRIDMYRRSEWEISTPPPFPTVGRNPRTVLVGPIGSEPPGSLTVHVVSAVVLGFEDRSQPSMLIYVHEFPTLVGFSTDESEIAHIGVEASRQSV